MSARKISEVDTAPQTPHSKGTISVRTGRSDPPPSLYPAPRPAAGSPASRSPQSSPRSATTIRSPMRGQLAPARGFPPRWLAALALVLLAGALLAVVLRGAHP